MLLLALSGCFYSSVRPYDAYLADLGSPATDPPTDVPEPTGHTGVLPTPPTVYEACSELGGELVDVTFVNQTELHVDLYYITADCDDLNAAFLPVGSTESRTTSIGEVWRIRDAFGGTGWVGEVRIDGDTEVVFE